ncbi:MAG TPA: isoprenylcysteine carboxylmethyltransferase family protein [Bryobacteraceae bacterium]|nr:isoprenylcysteine carboxylmethyltransferase family protein [Bryobacteraceae bacterium]
MCATKFEFEQRFWVFGAIFFVGFFLYQIDHLNAAAALLGLLAPSVNLDSSQGGHLLRLIFAIGVLLVFFAAAYRTWATAYLRTEIVHDMSLHSESIVAAGPYRYSRNPLYFANLFMAAGIGLMTSRAGWFFIVIAIWLFDYRLILREEQVLTATQGQDYQRYKNAVPRLWPAVSARVPPSSARAHWGQAFAGESMFWLFGLAMLAFTITLNGTVAMMVFALGIVVYFVAVYVTKKAARRP